jgi:Uma2 family endonuclease
MAAEPASVSIPIEEYETTPDLFEHHEYIDGVLIEKPAPTWKHIRLQSWLGVLFWKYYPSLAVGPELHSKVRKTAWRLPDFAVQRREIADSERYAYQPLILAIEILSPDDVLSKVLEKFEDYHKWGVPYGWLFDPERERAWTYHKGEFFEEVTKQPFINAGDIQLSIEEVFSTFKSAPGSPISGQSYSSK